MRKTKACIWLSARDCARLDRAGFRSEHAAEGGLAVADRTAVGGPCWRDGDHAGDRNEQDDGQPLAGALSR